MISRKGIPVAFANINVATVYIPSGKTSDQYCGSEVAGTRATTCPQKPKMTNSGIHHVPVAQKNSVKPPIKGWKSCRTSQLTKSQDPLIATSSEGLGWATVTAAKKRVD